MAAQTNTKKGKGSPNAGRKRALKGLPSIVKRRDGRYAVTVELPRSHDGKRQRLQSTCVTLEEAIAVGMHLAQQARLHHPADIATLTIEELLLRWQMQQPAGEPSTHLNRAWEGALLSLFLGKRLVSSLTPLDVTEMHRGMQAQGRAPSSVAKVHRLLRRILDTARNQKLIVHNVAELVKSPRVPPRVPEAAWTQEEVRAIIRVTEGHPLRALIVVAMATGARIGELLGAQPSDYNPATGELTISGTAKQCGGRGKAKTAAAHRVLPLSPLVRDVMQEHLQRVSQWKTEAGTLWGVKRETSDTTRAKQRKAARAKAKRPMPEGWQPELTRGSSYEALFCTQSGTPLSYRNVLKKWRDFLTEADLPYRRLHSTREAFITAALQDRSIPLPAIQQTVGHTSPVMTLRYAQRLRGAQADVITAAARVLGL